MDKISPEEKIQWMKKILQKKESYRHEVHAVFCVLSLLLHEHMESGFHDNRKQPVLRYEPYLPSDKPFWKRFSPGYLCPAQNFRCTDTQKMDYEV